MRTAIICALIALPVLFAVGCGEENTATPKCPDLSKDLYNVRVLLDPADASDAEAVAHVNDKAAKWFASGCVTTPGDASTRD
jgi:hypothetical protein